MAEKKKFSLVSVGFILLTIIAIAGVSASIFLFREWSKTKNLLNNPTEAAKIETKDLVARIQKLMVLPNEEPQIATVLEEEKLKEQQFFANVQKGDKVLVFTKAQKAILFRPSKNMIIEVAPWIAEASGSANASQQVFRFAIRNGTDVSTLPKKVEEELKTLVQNITVVDRENAKDKTQKETLVFDLTGTNAGAVSQLAERMGMKVGTTIPQGEPKPDADFLIIIGADKK